MEYGCVVHKRVIFKGETYWLHLVESGLFYNLSLLNHYNEEGQLLVDPFRAISYAIVINGQIKRFGEVIGYMGDLVAI